MTNRSSVQTPSEFQTVTIQTNPIAVADRMRDVYQSLSRRAYDLFEGRSHQHGHDVEDWLCAESELLCLVPLEIKWSDEQVTVRAEVPGFTAPDIEISAE